MGPKDDDLETEEATQERIDAAVDLGMDRDTASTYLDYRDDSSDETDEEE